MYKEHEQKLRYCVDLLIVKFDSFFIITFFFFRLLVNIKFLIFTTRKTITLACDDKIHLIFISWFLIKI